VFAAGYECQQGQPHEIAPPRALAPQALAELLGDTARWHAYGDGAVRYREVVEAAGAVVAADDSPLHRVSAAAVCELAVAAEPSASVTVLPDYRRRPDAEVALEGAPVAEGSR
jgi:tRNA threonylcarbamoyladenosine biosynthesis protein TsaB